MPEWLSILLAIFGGTGLLSLLVKDIYSGIKNNTKKAVQRKKEEKKAETLELAAEIVKPLETKLDNLTSKLDKVEDGTLSTLRNDILTCYYRCVEKHYRNDYDYQNMHHMFDTYKELNGNSYVADVMERFDNLPTKEEYEETLRATRTSKKSKKN